MLAPGERSSIYDALRPPPGCRTDLLIACTYSAALDTVLSLPAAMVAGVGEAISVKSFGAAEFAALRRVCGRTIIFCQGGAIHSAELLPPAIVEVEPMVHEVAAPMGGAFHPKLWVMRFEDNKGRSNLRVAVLSRNLTADRSWDLGLIAEGRPTGAARPNDISEMLRLLPGWCRTAPDVARLRLIKELADQVERTRWRLPEGLGSPEFTVIGTGPGTGWSQPESERLIVLSPFLTTPTLKALASTTAEGVALISRPEALDRCWPATSTFQRRMVLTPPEEGGGPSSAMLHGKALIWERRGRIRAAIGSLNATCAARLGRNVEFMVTVDCTAAVSPEGFQSLLGHEALGAIVQDYEPAEHAAILGEEFDGRKARALLCAADLGLRCDRESDGWRVALVAGEPLGLRVKELLPRLRYRLATQPRTAALAPCGAALAEGRPAPYPGLLELTSITGFVVFQADGPEGPIEFCRNVALTGADLEERRSAAVRALLPDRARFEQFLRTLLGDPSGSADAGGGSGEDACQQPWTAGPRPGLLELLVRCATDDADRFEALRRSVEALGPERLSAVAPDGFVKLWAALLEAAP